MGFQGPRSCANAGLTRALRDAPARVMRGATPLARRRQTQRVLFALNTRVSRGCVGAGCCPLANPAAAAASCAQCDMAAVSLNLRNSVNMTSKENSFLLLFAELSDNLSLVIFYLPSLL